MIRTRKRLSLNRSRAYMRGTAAALVLSALGASQGYAQVLAHRYSFNDANDSVGGANATILGTASVTGGQLVIPGGVARANCATIPIGATLAGTNSLTVETWFNTTTDQDWAKVWMFGTPGGSSGASGYIDFTPRSGTGGSPPSMSFKTINGPEITTRGGTNPPALTPGTATLSTVVYDDAADQIRLYINGVLVDSEVWTGTISQLGNTTQNYIGAPVFYGDPCYNGSVDELRIWKGAMSDAQVAADATAGPNSIAPHDPQLLTSTSVAATSPGGVTTINLPIQNKGTANSLTITAANITGDDASYFTRTTTLPLTIAPGATANLVLSFNPGTEQRTFNATVTTTSNDNFKPQEVINLSVQAAIPDIDVAPTASFGPVANTAPIQTYNLTINNVGQGELEVYDAEFVAGPVAPTHFQQFKLGRNFTTQGSLKIAKNSSAQFPITFDGLGLQPGTKTGILRLYTTDFDEFQVDVAISVEVTGTGGPEAMATIAHRWNFNDLNDSVGGATAILNGTASISGGSLVLPGGGTRANFAEVPVGRTFASSSSMTIEGWVTAAADAQNWSKSWMFGTPGQDEGSSTFADFTLYSGLDGTPPSISYRTPTLGQITTRDAPNPAALVANKEYHITAVYDSAAHTMSLYIDGVLADSGPWSGQMFLMGNTTQNYLGAPVFYGDQDWNGSISELRIWKGAMTANDVANAQTAGKDTLPTIGQPAAGPIAIGSVTISGGNIVLGNVTGLVAGTQYHLETGVTLTDFASVSGSTFTSTSTIPTVPVSGPRRFVRIVTGAAP